MKQLAIELILGSILILTFSSCKKNNTTENPDELHFISTYNIPDSIGYFGFIRSLKSKIINEGDVDSYRILKNIYMDDMDLLGLVPYSLIMANDYQHIFAFYDVFDCLLFAKKDQLNDLYDLDSLDKDTRSLALEYLMKAYVRGNKQAKVPMNKYIEDNKYSLKDTLLYRKQYEGIDHHY